MRPSATWWRRNRLWLALLLPLLLLAIVASSFRLVRIYLPWEWSRPIVAHATVGTLRQDFLGNDDLRHRREVTVGVLSVVPQQRHGDIQASPGATLWRVLLEFEASPDQMLQNCIVEVEDAAGVRYGSRAGQEPVEGSRLTPSISEFQRCVPEASPGPSLEAFTGTLVPSPVERPAAWRLEYLFALPEGVEPASVRIAWDRPEYLVLRTSATAR